MEENIGYVTAIGSVTMESGAIIGKQVADVKPFLIDLETLTVKVGGQQGLSIRP